MPKRLTVESRVIIREASVGDATAIAQVHVYAWQVAYKGIIPDSVLDHLSIQDRTTEWRKHLSKNVEQTLLVESNDIVAGWASFGQSRDDSSTPRTGEVYAIYLHPSVWRKGLGKLLHAEMERQLRQGGFVEVTLWVLEANHQARSFYSSLGYSQDGGARTKLRGGVEIPETRYRKPLRT